MIVKNEEPVLERCMNCVKRFADEIIIVDTGSTDNTKKMALSFTNRVYEFPWRDDFAAARNYSYSFAGCDYIMWLDADNIINDDDCDRINALKHSLSHNIDVVFMTEKAYNDEILVLRDRMIRRSLGAKWKYPIHEGIPMEIAPEDGKIQKLTCYNAKDITVWHKKEIVNDSERNIRIFEKMQSEGIPFTPFNYALYCRELYLFQRFEESYQAYLKVKASRSPYNIAHAIIFSTWSLQKLQKWETALDELTEALNWIVPSPLICCELGNCFYHFEMYSLAEFWYKLALSSRCEVSEYSLIFPAYYEYIPCQKLTKLYARSGNIKKAAEYNERAGKIRPDSSSVLLNRQYFANLVQNEGE